MQISSIAPQLTLKSGDYNSMIEGYASVFNVADNHNDIIAEGAFKTSINNPVKLLWQHDAAKPIGVVKLMREDKYGLKIAAEINVNTKDGSDARHLIKQGAVSGLSIGFNIKDFNYNNDGQRIISDLNLMEVSIVTFPANNMAIINQIKSSSYIDHKSLQNLSNLIKQLAKL